MFQACFTGMLVSNRHRCFTNFLQLMRKACLDDLVLFDEIMDLQDLKEKNVGVTAIFPAYVESDMTAKASFPSDKMIRPEDIAEAALLPFRMSKFACPSEIVVRNAFRPT